MAWSKDGYTCWDCEFFYDGYCAMKNRKVQADKLACKDFELA